MSKTQNLLDNIGAGLLTLRINSGLTQREAAKKAESTQARLSDLENGKAGVQVATLQRWADIYGYELEILFVPSEEETDETTALPT